MKKKEVPKKNYVLFLLLCIGTIFICFYLSSWYKTITDFKKNNSVITTVLSEVEIEGFSSYLMEYPDVLVYVSSTTDDNTKKFDKKFKKIIVENDLANSMLLLDMSKEENESALATLMMNYMDKDLSIKEISYPNLILFSEGKVSNILYKKETTITKDDVVKFLKNNGILNND